jgi:hypothetical protein
LDLRQLLALANLTPKTRGATISKEFEFTFWVTEAGIFAGPWLAVLVIDAIRRRRVWPLRNIFLGCLCVIGLVVLASIFRLQTTSITINCGVLLVAYIAFCAAAAISRAISPWELRLVPVIACYGLILLAYVYGIFGLLLVRAPHDQQPLWMRPAEFSQLRPGLACTVVRWKGPDGEQGYTLRLYRFLPSLPFVQMNVKDIVVDTTAFDSAPQSPSHISPTCQSAAASLGPT